MRVKRVDRKCFQEREEEGTFFFLFSSFFTGLEKIYVSSARYRTDNGRRKLSWNRARVNVARMLGKQEKLRYNCLVTPSSILVPGIQYPRTLSRATLSRCAFILQYPQINIHDTVYPHGHDCYNAPRGEATYSRYTRDNGPSPRYSLPFPFPLPIPQAVQQYNAIYTNHKQAASHPLIIISTPLPLPPSILCDFLHFSFRGVKKEGRRNGELAFYAAFNFTARIRRSLRGEKMVENGWKFS